MYIIRARGRRSRNETVLYDENVILYSSSDGSRVPATRARHRALSAAIMRATIGPSVQGPTLARLRPSATDHAIRNARTSLTRHMLTVSHPARTFPSTARAGDGRQAAKHWLACFPSRSRPRPGCHCTAAAAAGAHRQRRPDRRPNRCGCREPAAPSESNLPIGRASALSQLWDRGTWLRRGRGRWTARRVCSETPRRQAEGAAVEARKLVEKCRSLRRGHRRR